MIKKLTIYESFDGKRFDSRNEANNYEERLKDDAIRALCNQNYEEWEDYMFTQSKVSAKKGFQCSIAQHN